MSNLVYNMNVQIAYLFPTINCVTTDMYIVYDVDHVLCYHRYVYCV